MSAESSDPGHGHSPAAWTAIIIMLVGFIAGVFAFWFDQPWVVVGSAVVVVIGPIVGPPSTSHRDDSGPKPLGSHAPRCSFHFCLPSELIA